MAASVFGAGRLRAVSRCSFACNKLVVGAEALGIVLGGDIARALDEDWPELAAAAVAALFQFIKSIRGDGDRIEGSDHMIL